MKSLATALRVLRLFMSARSSWPVKEICADTGLNKSLVSKILREFRVGGILEQDPISREYSVAPAAVALAGNFTKSSSLCSLALGTMRRLVGSIEQTVTLCTMVGNEVMYLLSVEGPPFIDHGWRVGGWLPFHCTAAGKMLAASLAETEIDALIEAKGLPRYTPSTICEPDVLKSQLAKVRDEGVAVTHNEGTPGLGALAVPVLGHHQEVIAALGTVYPEHLVSAADRVRYAAGLHDVARRLSFNMGARVYPFGGREDSIQYEIDRSKGVSGAGRRK
jgi:DNA-binding IclR family transcriptional regulator